MFEYALLSPCARKRINLGVTGVSVYRLPYRPRMEQPMREVSGRQEARDGDRGEVAAPLKSETEAIVTPPPMQPIRPATDRVADLRRLL